MSTFATQVLRGERPLFAMFQTLGTQGLILCANLATGILMARLLGPGRTRRVHRGESVAAAARDARASPA